MLSLVQRATMTHCARRSVPLLPPSPVHAVVSQSARGAACVRSQAGNSCTPTARVLDHPEPPLDDVWLV